MADSFVVNRKYGLNVSTEVRHKQIGKRRNPEIEVKCLVFQLESPDQVDQMPLLVKEEKCTVILPKAIDGNVPCKIETCKDSLVSIVTVGDSPED